MRRGENLDGGEIRNVVLNERFAVGEMDRDASSVSAPFVVAIPEIAQPEKLDLFPLPWMPQSIQFSNLRLQEKKSIRRFDI